jgi:hypothetical protein
MRVCIVPLIYYTCDVNICVEIDPSTHMLCTRLCPLGNGCDRCRTHHASTSAHEASLTHRERAATGPSSLREQQGRHDRVGPGPRAPRRVPRPRRAGMTSHTGASHVPCRAPWPRAGTLGQGPHAGRAKRERAQGPRAMAADAPCLAGVGAGAAPGGGRMSGSRAMAGRARRCAGREGSRAQGGAEPGAGVSGVRARAEVASHTGRGQGAARTTPGHAMATGRASRGGRGPRRARAHHEEG